MNNVPCLSLESVRGFLPTLQHSRVLLNEWQMHLSPLRLLSASGTHAYYQADNFSFVVQLEQERREAEMRAKREEEERKRQEELRRQQEEILRRQQEEERKRREEEELARRKQVCLRSSAPG